MTQITGPDAAERYGVRRSTLRNWYGKGHIALRGYGPRRTAILDTEDIERFLRERSAATVVRAAKPRCNRPSCRRTLPEGATRCTHCGYAATPPVGEVKGL